MSEEVTARMLELRAARPRDNVLRASICGFALLLVGSWVVGSFDVADLFSARRQDNLARFLHDVRPFPLQDAPWSWSGAVDWALELLRRTGFVALATTAAIAVLSIVLAAAFGALAAVASARTLATPTPFLSSGSAPQVVRARLWAVWGAAVRVMLTWMRALPEYVLAFLLLAVLGSSAWPIILALAIHNAGILGRLYGETIENADPRTPIALRAVGASRLQLAAIVFWPTLLGRGLLYLFYRFETCIRDATMLGMIGVASLGYHIHEARTATRYDELLFFVVLGGVLVVLGDLGSLLARRSLR